MVNKLPVARLPVSERSLFMLTNTILIMFSVLLVGVCSFILDQSFSTDTVSSAVSYDTTTSAVQGSRIFIYVLLILVLGLWICCSSLVGMVAAARLNFFMLLVNFFCSTMASPIMFIFSVLCLDFHDYFRAWSTLSWTQDDMRRIRSFFCDKAALMVEDIDDITTAFGRSTTANVECNVPLEGGADFDSEDLWCANKTQYANTGICTYIRDQSTEDFYEWSLTWLNMLGSLGVMSVSLMLICNGLVVRIVTIQTIMNKLQHMINVFLIVPVAFCALVGVYLVYQLAALELEQWYLGYLYISAAGVTLIFAIVGAFGGRKKNRELLYVHMVGSAFSVSLMVVCSILTYYVMLSLESEYPISSDEDVQRVACNSGQQSCCCCDIEGAAVDERCKGWTRDHLVDIISFDLKLAGLVSFLSIFFSGLSIWISGKLRLTLQNYRVDFV